MPENGTRASSPDSLASANSRSSRKLESAEARAELQRLRLQEQQEQAAAKAKLRQEFMDTFKAVQPEFIQQMQEPMQNLVVGIMADKFSEVQGKVGALEKTTQQMQLELKAQGEVLTKQGLSLDSLHEQFDKALAGNAMLRSSSAPTAPSQGTILRSQAGPPPPPTGLFRDTNKTILFVTTEGAKDVTKDSIKHAVTTLAMEANIGEDDFEVIGENLGSKFEIALL